MPEITWGQIAVAALLYVTLFWPSIRIYRAWRNILQGRASSHTALERNILIVVTGSQALLMSGMVSSLLIGVDYSNRRYATIVVNLGAMSIAAAVAVVARRHVSWQLACSTGWVALNWLYMLAVSSVV